MTYAAGDVVQSGYWLARVEGVDPARHGYWLSMLSTGVQFWAGEATLAAPTVCPLCGMALADVDRRRHKQAHETRPELFWPAEREMDQWEAEG